MKFNVCYDKLTDTVLGNMSNAARFYDSMKERQKKAPSIKRNIWERQRRKIFTNLSVILQMSCSHLQASRLCFLTVMHSSVRMMIQPEAIQNEGEIHLFTVFPEYRFIVVPD